MEKIAIPHLPRFPFVPAREESTNVCARDVSSGAGCWC